MPVVHDLCDGQQFDLGGGRIVTAYHCPGHSAGEMVFLDEQTRTLFAGDALNYNLGVGAVPVETTLRALKRIRDKLGGKYDGIYNGHHDFRALGAPLGEDCLPTVIEMLEDVMAGHIVPCEALSFWGQSVPLTGERTDPMAVAPAATGMSKARPKRTLLRKGRNFLNINADNTYEKTN